MARALWGIWLLLAVTSLAAAVLLGPLFDTHALAWVRDEPARRRHRWLMGLAPLVSVVVGCCFCAGKVSFADGLARFVHEPSLGGYSKREAEGDQRSAVQMGCGRLWLACAAVGVLNTWILFLLAALASRLLGGR